MKGLRTKAADSSEAFVDTSLCPSDTDSNALLDLTDRSLNEIAVDWRGPFPDGPEP